MGHTLYTQNLKCLIDYFDKCVILLDDERNEKSLYYQKNKIYKQSGSLNITINDFEIVGEGQCVDDNKNIISYCSYNNTYYDTLKKCKQLCL